MRKYVLAILRSGPDRNQDSATAAQLQAEHLANIEAGRLVMELHPRYGPAAPQQVIGINAKLQLKQF